MSPAFPWTDSTVRAALGLPPPCVGVSPAGAGEATFSGISTDTRTAGRGALFVALVGERFDGHDFLRQAEALEMGAAVVSREPQGATSLPLYHVEDTLVALGALAHYRRRALSARVAAVTGSSGKTAVKDLVTASLSGTFRVHATQGNLNNRVGLPLTLLSAPEDAEVVVLEMGTSVPGEIAVLTEIADPDVGLVTTVSEAHLEGLGSLERVLEEKLALLQGAKDDAVLVVGDEPPALLRRARELRPDVHVAGVSEQADADLRGELGDPGPEGRRRVRFWDWDIEAGLPGKHGAKNLVLALALAKLMGAPADTAVRGASGVRSGKLRGEIRAVGGLTLLLDCYNANPQSVVAALDLLGDLPALQGRVAFLASMLELGERSVVLHRQVLEQAMNLPLEIIVAVGAFASAASELGEGVGPRLVPASTPDEGYNALRQYLRGSETVLLKGSRGMQLERLVPRFEEDFGARPTGERKGA